MNLMVGGESGYAAVVFDDDDDDFEDEEDCPLGMKMESPQRPCS